MQEQVQAGGGKTGREREQVHMGVREHLKIRAFD